MGLYILANICINSYFTFELFREAFSPSYPTLSIPLLCVYALSNIVMLVGWVSIGVLFVRKRRILPRSLMQLLFLAVALNVLRVLIQYGFGLHPDQDDALGLAGAIKGFVFWTVFFGRSKRARITFVR